METLNSKQYMNEHNIETHLWFPSSLSLFAPRCLFLLLLLLPHLFGFSTLLCAFDLESVMLWWDIEIKMEEKNNNNKVIQWLVQWSMTGEELRT